MFNGSIVALITPMKINGDICYKDLKKLVNYHIKNNTKAIVSVGTTGESATLTQDEHYNVIIKTVKYAKKKIPIIAGTGSNSTSESIELTKKLENSGISACLSVVPYYNKPTQEGMFKHFKKISENTNIPQILYNIPQRTGSDLLSETVIKLSKIENIIGIKEASGDLSRVNSIKSFVNKNFLLISGDDITALDFIKLGGKAVISVTANINPYQMSKMCKYAINNNFKKARKIHHKLSALNKMLFIETNPIPIKWLAKKIGLINCNKIRLPLTKLSKKNINLFNILLENKYKNCKQYDIF
ncbi:4-hydroxy-tetrahydrodipicolinate synthase [Buchnera aphidicola (Chaitoregma tattakana)]|uniref:4-hydroxy-tetrahydrodipicolinate synthase n=1 Tax=Buchnera aphidicola TaxID=9 RepID=UPI0031B860EA